MSNKATPRLWKKDIPPPDADYYPALFDDDATGSLICSFDSTSRTRQQNIENLEFAYRAVNAYDPMRASLEKAAGEFDLLSFNTVQPEQSAEYAALARECRAAIVEGKDA